MSSDAVSNLRKHAVKVLKVCWEMIPADLSRSQKALHRLLPTTGWPLPLLSHDGSSGGTPGSSDPTWLPLPGQQAEVAAVLLQQVRRHILHMMYCLYAKRGNNKTSCCIATYYSMVWYCVQTHSSMLLRCIGQTALLTSKHSCSPFTCCLCFTDMTASCWGLSIEHGTHNLLSLVPISHSQVHVFMLCH